jgi:hypothetical protein
VPSSIPTEPSSESSRPVPGKGRPTPSRKDAEAARKERIRPTLDKREARKRNRAEAKAQRDTTYQRMLAGDEKAFPLRDQGPVRRFVRDYVDGRRMFAEWFLPVMLVILMISLLPVPAVVRWVTLAWLVGIAMVLTELVWLWFQIKKQLRVRYPNQWGRGDLFYGVMRATQMRRLRLPRPAIKPGQPPR